MIIGNSGKLLIRLSTLDSRALLFSRVLFREPATEGSGKTAT